MIQTDTAEDSIKIALAPGKYSLLVYNYGESNIQLRNRNSFEQALIAFVTHKDGHSVTSSIPLYGVVINEFEVHPNQDEKRILKPVLFTKRVRFQVNMDKEHAGEITDCKGILAGVTPELHLFNRKAKRETTTRLPVSLQKDGDSYHGEVLLLDGAYLPDDTEYFSHELTLDFFCHDGSQLSSSINMGSKLFNIQRQEINVGIKALIQKSTEKIMHLECESIEALSN